MEYSRTSSAREILLGLLGALAILSGMVPATAGATTPELARQASFDAQTSAFHASRVSIPVRDPGPPAGAQVLSYRFGPMRIEPGQNLINVDIQKQRPAVNGWIVSFRPGLVYAANGRSPSVDTIHLHHAVWLVGDSYQSLQPAFAAGEEKTYFNAPAGFGWRYTTSQAWLINHMIHNLTAAPQEVYITYTLYFIPDAAPQAQGITPIQTQWMDVQGLKPYPVFNAPRGAGTGGRLTYPDQVPNAYRDGVIRNRWVATHDGTMVETAGHLHPGGLDTDLDITRNGVTRRVFRSRADYFDPVGSVSWDVAMSGTAPDWRVNFRRGDVISIHATYDTSRASWFEVMGIMVVGVTAHPIPGGVDPFSGTPIDQADYLTHGRLPENVDLGIRRAQAGMRNPLRLRAGPFRDRITINNFTYSQGDLAVPGAHGLPPRVHQGRSLTFVNQDSPLTVRYHTITACRAPCNLTGGIGYPLGDGRSVFDSGELGYGPAIDQSAYASGGSGTVPISPVINVATSPSNCATLAQGIVRALNRTCIGTVVYRTPSNLSPGLYTYFCRIHPFMRGAFRVVRSRGSRP